MVHDDEPVGLDAVTASPPAGHDHRCPRPPPNASAEAPPTPRRPDPSSRATDATPPSRRTHGTASPSHPIGGSGLSLRRAGAAQPASLQSRKRASTAAARRRPRVSTTTALASRTMLKRLDLRAHGVLGPQGPPRRSRAGPRGAQQARQGPRRDPLRSRRQAHRAEADRQGRQDPYHVALPPPRGARKTSGRDERLDAWPRAKCRPWWTAVNSQVKRRPSSDPLVQHLSGSLPAALSIPVVAKRKAVGAVRGWLRCGGRSRRGRRGGISRVGVDSLSEVDRPNAAVR